MTAPGPELDFNLAPEDVATLLRQPELLIPGTRKRLLPGRAVTSSLLWHDTAEGELAADGHALAHPEGRAMPWRLERLVPASGEFAPPGLPPRLLHESESAPEEHAASLLPVAAFDHTTRELRPASNPPRVLLRQGALRAVAAQAALCRLSLSGEGASALALAWGERLNLSVPTESLAAQALRLAGRAVPQRPLGAPKLNAEANVSDAFAALVAHLAGVMLHHAGSADGRHGPEPVHQMRVALRRLRSAMVLFRRAVSCPTLVELKERLKLVGAVLGPARDWDVFVLGTGSKLAQAFADDAAVQSLLTAARKRQARSYAALASYLAHAEWRRLGLSLTAFAVDRPWHAPSPDAREEDIAERAALLSMKVADFADRALTRRYRALTAAGADISGMDVSALHDLRLLCKQMRYACEFFAPFHPGRGTRRFVKRLAELQERLGQVNDATVAGGLMAQLGGRGSARAQAVGIVRGFVAAHSPSERNCIERTWRKLLRLECFWD